MKLIIATLLAGLTQAENLFHQRGYSSMNEYLELMELQALEALAFDMQEDYEIDTYDLEEDLIETRKDEDFTQWLRDSYKRTYTNIIVIHDKKVHCPQWTGNEVAYEYNGRKGFKVYASNGPFECCNTGDGGFKNWAFTGLWTRHGDCVRFVGVPPAPPPRQKKITRINGDWKLITSGPDITYSLEKSVTNTDGSRVSNGTTNGYSVEVGISVTVGGDLFGFSATSSLKTTASTTNSIVQETSQQLSNSTKTTCSATCSGSNHKNQRMYQWVTRASKSDGGYFDLGTCHYRCLEYGVSTDILKTPFGG